jgi:hypothetical protein
MLRNRKNDSSKKSSFVPRLAFGCVGAGMSVLPHVVGCSSSGAGFTGIVPYIPDAAAGPDAGFTGILPYIPDASADDAGEDDAADAAKE